ncbi:hypothetical protein PTKU15_84570 [Paraburkholderia terrae]|nr:hypothetical protein PTKU15_84570 [Paraburkholderia terrae]
MLERRVSDGKAYGGGEGQSRAPTPEEDRSLGDHPEEAQNRGDRTISFAKLSRHQIKTIVNIPAECCGKQLHFVP